MSDPTGRSSHPTATLHDRHYGKPRRRFAAGRDDVDGHNDGELTINDLSA
jgi:hypothetical protein